jgi:hypothetical protein
MGYIVLPVQLKTINQIVDKLDVESMTLLWLPQHIQLIVWDKRGNYQTHKINEDGKIENEASDASN